MPSSKHLAALIAGHHERQARDWGADRRALPWVDRPWIDLFAGLLPAGGAVLDLGCGGGDPVATSLLACGPNVTGVETSPTLISLCRERMPAGRWVVADMRTLGLDARFDGLLAWDSFFHLKPDDQAAIFPVFTAHASRGAVLMFNAGPARSEAIGQPLSSSRIAFARRATRCSSSPSRAIFRSSARSDPLRKADSVLMTTVESIHPDSVNLFRMPSESVSIGFSA
jgi:SAM-dependent methyltransferase